MIYMFISSMSYSLWENLKKWSSKEEMRGTTVIDGHYGGGPGGYGGQKQHMTNYGGGGGGPVGDDLDYQQMGGLRRLDSASANSIRAHFYPEGGWGWIVCACAFLAHVTTSGAQLSAGALHIVLANKFHDSTTHHWLGPLSWSVSSLFSPLVVNLCRRKNVRVLSLIGGLLFPLSLLCTSFATELHQIFFSFSLMGGIGSSFVRESSGVVLGEYFRRRRHFVEQVVLAGTGVGVTLFSLLYLSLSRHIEWTQGFRIGALLSTICALLPAFYRTAAVYHPNRAAIQQLNSQRQMNKTSGSGGMRSSSLLLPLGGDIFHSLHLFCVPALKPILWSACIASFGLYAPVFLMSDFGRKEGLSGGSLLLLQTHLGLGLSLGVILGAILTLKKFRCCHITPRMLCCSTCVLTGISMIAISSVQGYYGYSLSAWIYGIALGSYLYTLKILTMDLTRTKYWGRIWSCIQSLMAPGILLGTGATAYMGKPGFYACATCVLVGAGLIGFQLIDLSKCGSPPLSSVEDNESPIPPVPPPVLPSKYGVGQVGMGGGGGGPNVMNVNVNDSPNFFPLRKSISLQQPFYPCCSQDSGGGGGGGKGGDVGGFGGSASALGLGLGGGLGLGYSPHCPDCNPLAYPPMIRSYSLPQALPQQALPPSKTTGTQTNPNSPERHPLASLHQHQHQQQQHHRQLQQQLEQHVSSQKHHQVLSHQSIFPTSFDDRLPPTTSSSAAAAAVSSTGGGAASSSASHHFQSQVYPEPLVRLPHKHSVMFASNPQLYPQSSYSSQTDSSRPPSAANFYVPQQQQQHQQHHHHRQEPSASSSQSQAQQQQHGRQQGRGGSAAAALVHGQSGAFNLASSFQSQQQQHGQRQSSQSQLKQQPILSGQQHARTGDEAQKFYQQQQQEQQQQQQPAFTRHYFDSSKILQNKKSNAQHVQFRKPERDKEGSGGGGGGGNKPTPSSDQAGKSSQMRHLLQKQQNIISDSVIYSSTSVVRKGDGGGGGMDHDRGMMDPSIPPSVFHVQAQIQQNQQQQQQQASSSSAKQSSSHHQGHYKQPNVGQQLKSQQQQQQQQQQHQRRFSEFQPTPHPNYSSSQHQQQQYQSSRGPKTSHNNNFQQSSSSQQQQYNMYHPQQHQQQAGISSVSGGSGAGAGHYSIIQPLDQQQKLQQFQQQSYNHPYYYYGNVPPKHKISSSEFDIEEPKFNSLRRPTSANSSVASTSTGPIPSVMMIHGHHHGGGGGMGPTSAFLPSSSASPCPYCDLGPDRMCPPLSLSVPTIQQNNPHLLCHYGLGVNPPPGLSGHHQQHPGQQQPAHHQHHPMMLRRRNTWHYHKDFLEAITTSAAAAAEEQDRRNFQNRKN